MIYFREGHVFIATVCSLFMLKLLENKETNRYIFSEEISRRDKSLHTRLSICVCPEYTMIAGPVDVLSSVQASLVAW